ncbi:hypothetical protein D1872_99070 [compost metagenome]
MNPTVQVIVDKEYVRQMAERELKLIFKDIGEGTWWDMKRLEVETCRKRDWLLENVLLNPTFKEEMSLITNNCDGGRWMIRAKEMKVFLDKHFHYLNRTKNRSTNDKEGEKV